MAYRLGNICAKNLCKPMVLLQLIIENVVTCFLEHSVDKTVCFSPPSYLPLYIMSHKKYTFERCAANSYI